MKYYVIGGIVLAVMVIAVVVTVIMIHAHSYILDGPGMVNSHTQDEYNIDITFKNEAVRATVWILPETEENKRTTLWGEATVPEAESEDGGKFTVSKKENAATFIFRAIDSDSMYYEANGITLDNGYSVIFKQGESPRSFTIETVRPDGQTVNVYPVFAAKL